LAELIRHEKRRHHRDLPVWLQRVEADIVINSVALAFAQRHAGEDLCLLSMHDCFITTEEHVDELKSLLASEYEKTIGFVPKISVKPLKAQDHADTPAGAS
jgi:hypothetical protein